MINVSGFTLKTSTTTGGEKDTASTGDELINSSDIVEMVAGKNIKVKQVANGTVTYSTKDDVAFNTIALGNNTTTSPVVNMTTEVGKPVSNNNASSTPTAALKITSSDGKPTQITGVTSTLNTATVPTAPNGSTGTNKPNVTLVDLAKATNPNAAATVGDLQNMGWVVSALDGNGYVDAVKNAN